MATPSQADIVSYLTQQASSFGVPPTIAQRVLFAEDPRLDPGARSPAGAIGLMQLMPGTASDMGVDPNDWRENIQGGLKYLSKLYRQFGTWPEALRAYNAGPAHEAASYGYPETNAYVGKVLGMTDAAPASPAIGGMNISPLIAQLVGAYKVGEPARKAAAADVGRLGAEAEKVADTPDPAAPPAPHYYDTKPPPAQPKDDPYRVFGQMMPMLLAFGALATRGGGVAALKAATAAMKGAHDKDSEAYKNARQEWLDNTEQVAKENLKINQEFKDILERDDLSMREKTAKLNALTSAAGMKVQQSQLESGELGQLSTITNSMISAATRLGDLAIKERALEGGAMSQEAIDFAAREVLAGEPMPSMGFGKEGALAREKVLERAAQMSKGEYGSVDAGAEATVEKKHVVRADTASLTQSERQQQSVRQFSQTAYGLADKVEQMVDHVAAQGPEVWAKFVSNVRTGVLADPQTREFLGYVKDLQSENAKIMAGATGSVAQVSAHNQEMMNDILDGKMPASEIKGALRSIREGIRLRNQAVEDEVQNQRKQIASDIGPPKGGEDSQPPADYPDAKKAPDGHWYVKKDGAWYRVNP